MKICGVNVLISAVQALSTSSVDRPKSTRYFTEAAIYKTVGYKGDVSKEREVQNLISQHLLDRKCQPSFSPANWAEEIVNEKFRIVRN